MIQDCYFVAGASALAVDSNFTKSLFLGTSIDNSTQIADYKFQMFALGQPFEIIVDDRVPVFQPVP